MRSKSLLKNFEINIIYLSLIGTFILTSFIIFITKNEHSALKHNNQLLSDLLNLTDRLILENELLNFYSELFLKSKGKREWHEAYTKEKKSIEETITKIENFNNSIHTNIEFTTPINLTKKINVIISEVFRLSKENSFDEALSLLNSSTYTDLRLKLFESLKKITSLSDEIVKNQNYELNVQFIKILLSGLALFLLIFNISIFFLLIIKKFRIGQRLMEKEIFKMTLEKSKEEKARAHFLSHIRHAISSPITSIIGFSKMLATKELKPEEKKNARLSVENNSLLLLNAIDEIVDFSQLQSGNFKLSKEKVNLVDILTSLYSNYIYKALEKNVSFQISVDDTIPKTITTNPHRVTQILSSLLDNAIKFTDDGKIHLKVKYKKNLLEFIVSDTGKGMSFLEKKEIFIPFASGYLRRDRFESNVIGFAFYKELAKALGGDLVLLSTEKDIGSTFKLTIDAGEISELVEFHISNLLNNKNIVYETKLNGKVLLVDDDPDTCLLIKRYLSDIGLIVDVARNGSHAIELALKDSYDIIIMDIELPAIDGYEVIKILRKHRYSKPILVISGHTMQGVKENCYSLGCSDFISKPVNPKVLYDTIQRYQVNSS